VCKHKNQLPLILLGCPVSGAAAARVSCYRALLLIKLLLPLLPQSQARAAALLRQQMLTVMALLLNVSAYAGSPKLCVTHSHTFTPCRHSRMPQTQDQVETNTHTTKLQTNTAFEQEVTKRKLSAYFHLPP
jgi:hypothetical protein